MNRPDVTFTPTSSGKSHYTLTCDAGSPADIVCALGPAVRPGSLDFHLLRCPCFLDSPMRLPVEACDRCRSGGWRLDVRFNAISAWRLAALFEALTAAGMTYLQESSPHHQPIPRDVSRPERATLDGNSSSTQCELPASASKNCPSSNRVHSVGQDRSSRRQHVVDCVRASHRSGLRGPWETPPDRTVKTVTVRTSAGDYFVALLAQPDDLFEVLRIAARQAEHVPSVPLWLPCECSEAPTQDGCEACGGCGSGLQISAPMVREEDWLAVCADLRDVGFQTISANPDRHKHGLLVARVRLQPRVNLATIQFDGLTDVARDAIAIRLRSLGVDAASGEFGLTVPAEVMGRAVTGLQRLGHHVSVEDPAADTPFQFLNAPDKSPQE